MSYTSQFTTTAKQLRPFLARIILLLSIFVLASIGFVAIVYGVRSRSTLALDRSILELIHRHASSLFDHLIPIVTNFGGPLAVIILTAGLVGWLLYTRKMDQAVFVLTSIVGSSLINVIVKNTFQRSRPTLWARLVHESSFSFPSGHAMASSALAACVVVLVWKTKWRLAGIIGGISYMLIIGFSRLYLGVHYPSDILGGWLLSLAWVIVVGSVLFTRNLRRRPL